MNTNKKAIRFTRTDIGDGASEVLTICAMSTGEDFYSEALEASTPYVVQITRGPDIGGDFIGLYDLDGEKLSPVHGSAWEIAECVPPEVIEALKCGWASGSNVMERLTGC